MAIGYFTATSDASHTAKAIKQNSVGVFTGKIISSIPFSSGRKFGSATLDMDGSQRTVVVGAPDILSRHIQDPIEKKWVEDLVHIYAPKAKRLVLLSTSAEPISEQLEGASLIPKALFILANPLRKGTQEIIKFFQEHGVRIRVISGDNAETVRAIAEEAGIKYSDLAITGPEMANWDDAMYQDRVPAYHIFARIKPEQKEKIIETLKLNGFTAMVGDGANDALAIKKADLGIAMFDGAGATRSIAQIVLMNNSFAALPTGVTLADSIITNIELVASVFFNRVAVGLLLFIILAALGKDFPLSPRNTTIMGYFTVGLPIFYLALWPITNPERALNRPFLRKILPYSLLQSVIIAAAATGVYFISPRALQHASSNVLIMLTLIALEFTFFILAPLAYASSTNTLRPKTLLSLAGGSALALFLFFLSPTLRYIFDLRVPPLFPFLLTALIVMVTIYIQYQITKRWFGGPKAK
jgi:cation-transporting ATPase E